MDKGKYKGNYQEVISMEEYLAKRQIIKGSEQKKKAVKIPQKNSAWWLAELYAAGEQG